MKVVKRAIYSSRLFLGFSLMAIVWTLLAGGPQVVTPVGVLVTMIALTGGVGLVRYTFISPHLQKHPELARTMPARRTEAMSLIYIAAISGMAWLLDRADLLTQTGFIAGLAALYLLLILPATFIHEFEHPRQPADSR